MKRCADAFTALLSVQTLEHIRLMLNPAFAFQTLVIDSVNGPVASANLC